MDLHQRVIVTPPIDSNVIHKYRSQELPSLNTKDVKKDDSHGTSRYKEFIENSASMYVCSLSLSLSLMKVYQAFGFSSDLLQLMLKF